MKAYISSLVMTITLQVCIGAQLDYYWKDFDGNVPSDAFEAGSDKYGKPIYIGQGSFLSRGLFPGTLHAGCEDLTSTATSSVFTINKGVKILCTKHPHKLRWKSLNYNDIAGLTNIRLVLGGQETDSDVHIGRALHEGSTEIGKVYNIAPFQGLTLPNAKLTSTIYKTFELLVYSPNELYPVNIRTT